MDSMTLVGNGLSLVGIVIAIWQIIKTRKAAQAASHAASQAEAAIKRSVLLSEISTAAKGVDELQIFIRSHRYEAALLRVSDLRGRLIEVQSLPGFSRRSLDLKEPITQIAILQTLLEDKLHAPDTAINPSHINKILSEISDRLHAWIGSNAYTLPTKEPR